MEKPAWETCNQMCFSQFYGRTEKMLRIWLITFSQTSSWKTALWWPLTRRLTQNCLRTTLSPHFRPNANNPVLNPVDYAIRGALELKSSLCHKICNNKSGHCWKVAKVVSAVYKQDRRLELNGENRGHIGFEFWCYILLFICLLKLQNNNSFKLYKTCSWNKPFQHLSFRYRLTYIDRDMLSLPDASLMCRAYNFRKVYLHWT